MQKDKQLQSRFNIVVDPTKCVGCLLCQMRCSFRFTKSFCPMASLIGIDWSEESYCYRITFSDKCDSCGLCARSCVYRALNITAK
jgi:Fe-S-cluster-containing dehydrogenase component